MKIFIHECFQSSHCIAISLEANCEYTS